MQSGSPSLAVFFQLLLCLNNRFEQALVDVAKVCGGPLAVAVARHQQTFVRQVSSQNLRRQIVRLEDVHFSPPKRRRAPFWGALLVQRISVAFRFTGTMPNPQRLLLLGWRSSLRRHSRRAAENRRRAFGNEDSRLHLRGARRSGLFGRHRPASMSNDTTSANRSANGQFSS